MEMHACPHLQVIDETDRLLRQAYQDWLPFVMGATSPALESLPGYSGSSGRTHAAPGSHAVYKSEQRVLKIVASATLTRDPAKLERLLLHAPRCIAVGAAGHRRACMSLHLSPYFLSPVL